MNQCVAFIIMGAKQMEKEAPSSAVVLPYLEKKEKIIDPSKRFKKICVFCGSSSGKKGVFSNEALILGSELVCQPFKVTASNFT